MSTGIEKKGVAVYRTTWFNQKNIKYFRRFFYNNLTLQIEHSYLIRNEVAEYFPFRLWVLRYKSWLVIVLNWYRPQKGKGIGEGNNRSRINQRSLSTFSKSKHTNYSLIRLKVMLNFFYKFNNVLIKSYNF